MNSRIQEILRRAGITDQVTLVRASGGQRNETWLCGAYVVRLGLGPNQHFLAREAALLQHLANAIPVPNVIAYGDDDGGEWMIQEKVAGVPLAHVWSTLEERTRRSVVVQLAEILETLHQTPCDALPIVSLPKDWLTSTLPTAVRQLAEQTKLLRFVEEALMDAVLGYADELDDTQIAPSTWGLVHGDLHFDNILWDGQQIAALLDFEKACYAPLDLELDLFLRYCAFPALFVAEEFEHLTQSEDYNLVPLWFRQAYPALFDNLYLSKRLGLYSLHYDLTLLQRFPPNGEVDPTEEDHLLNRIRAVIEQRGYLSKIVQLY